MKKYISLIFVSIVLMSCSILQNTNPNPYSENAFFDIAYGELSESQKMDIYLPAWTGPFPVIIVIHGGAFKMGDKKANDVVPIIQAWTKNGYAVVSINYRLSGEAPFPAAIEDVQKAIFSIKEQAKNYNINPDKIVVWWDSAGGHLAALAGTMGDVTKNTHVQAVVDWFGPIYFSTMDAEFNTLWITPKMWQTNTENSPESQYIGKVIGTPEAEILVKKSSPETYITIDDPAFFIQHGSADNHIPSTQSKNFAQALKTVLWEEKVYFELIPWAWHGGAEFETEENFKKIFNFLKIHL